jgi:acetyltransferase-like isoleucine patch superfamily enzyme
LAARRRIIGGFVARLARCFYQAKAFILFRRRVSVFGNFTAVVPSRISLGRNCAINHGVFLNALSPIEIQDDVILSARCMLIGAKLDPEQFIRGRRTYLDAPLKIESGVWIGAGAIILGGVTVGAGSIVGAGSVVTRDVPPHSIVAGNPARVIRSITASVSTDAAEAETNP